MSAFSEQTAPRVGMPLDQFLAEAHDRPFELLNGEKYYLMPTVYGHTFIIHLLYQMILEVVTQSRLGIVHMETTYILPDAHGSDWVSGARVPDVLYIAGDRYDTYRANTPDWRARPISLVPDFVIEVVSPNDRYSDIDAKVDAYLADGVRLIWVIDPQRRKAAVHTPDRDQPLHLREEAVLSGGEVLPGLEIQMAALFV